MDLKDLRGKAQTDRDNAHVDSPPDVTFDTDHFMASSGRWAAIVHPVNQVGLRKAWRGSTRRNQHVSAAQQRAIHIQRVAALRDMLAVAQPTAPIAGRSAPNRQSWRES
ncbi:hypothetical protein F1643_15455 [Azospirillum sp. INR13]|uniref:hypothetical protein n=1 Tax=Azospirillum sp. INR13 TaxID=2596919 RepID=UPI0018927D52|nr:hypothetical protein [Azospirillum sp. INR13]MBF5095618.1 hypothetical protein [Azospirillum sp. INR13]